MKFKEWNKFAELVGIAAIVASLLFVGLQMKQAEDIANATRRSSVVANSIELNSAINEYADIWRRGNAGELLDGTETVIFRNLVFSKVALHRHESSAAQHLESEGGVWAHIIELAIYMHENPGAWRMWNEQRQMFRDVLLTSMEENNASDGFADRVFSVMEKLDQAEE